MLYIPEGTWGESVYDGDWYKFNNIRETAMLTNAISPTHVYTLMDTNTFGYAVYDGTNDQVKMMKAFYSIDEQDLNNCWLLQTQAGKKYLYNVGARKYATISTDGRITLTDNATDIEVTEGENGLILGANTTRQWGFVKNNSHTDITNIAPQISNSGQAVNNFYSIGGQKILSPQRGLNIVKMNDGTTTKVVKK